jgi:hypothetical protein
MFVWGTRRFSITISEWPVLPCMVSTSRTSFQPSEGMSTKKAELAAWGSSGSCSVRAIKMAKFELRAWLMNHLCPLMIQSSPSRTAVVWIRVGSEPATSGSVMAKHERARPSHSGTRYFSRCSGVAQWSSVCMLPSSGAWAFSANGPKRVRAASALTAAIAT